MIKNLPKKEIKTLIPDYVFDLLDKSEKDSFEAEIKKYPDLQQELHETQALFDKVNINNINKYNDEQIDSITSDLSDNVINKLNELNTNKNIQPIDFFTNFAKQTHFEDTSFILLIEFNHGRTKITDHRGGFLLDEETIR